MPESLPGATTALREELEREKARADAAEARIVEVEELYATSEVARMVKLNAETTEALAAARRECEGLREALLGLLESAGFDWDGGAEVDASVEDAVAKARAALASPGDGEEGKR